MCDFLDKLGEASLNTGDQNQHESNKKFQEYSSKVLDQVIQLRKEKENLSKANDLMDNKLKAAKTELSELLLELKRSETLEETHELKRLKSLLNCYRLSGISVSSYEEGKIVVQFDTIVRKFQDPFYTEIELKGQACCLGKNNLPPHVNHYVQTQEFSATLELPKFTKLIYESVSAFAMRKREIEELENIVDNSFPFNIKVTDSCDYVELQFGNESDGLCVQISLMYTNILDVTPSRIVFTLSTDQDDDEAVAEALKEENIIDLKTKLKTQKLSKALERFVITYKALTKRKIKLEN